MRIGPSSQRLSEQAWSHAATVTCRRCGISQGVIVVHRKGLNSSVFAPCAKCGQAIRPRSDLNEHSSLEANGSGNRPN